MSDIYIRDIQKVWSKRSFLRRRMRRRRRWMLMPHASALRMRSQMHCVLTIAVFEQ